MFPNTFEMENQTQIHSVLPAAEEAFASKA